MQQQQQHAALPTPAAVSQHAGPGASSSYDGSSRPLRLAAFECEDSDKWRGLTEEYMRNAFGRPGDSMDIFCVARSEFPSDEDLKSG